MNRSDFLQREDRRRALLSWAIAAAFYSLAFLASYLLGINRPSELAELPSPVWVSIQSSETMAAIPPRGEAGEVELPEGPALPQVAPSVIPSQSPRTGPQSPAPAPAATSPPAPVLPALSAAAPSAPATASAPAAPAEPWTPGARPQGSRITSSESTGFEVPRSGGGFSTRIQGSEQGNSLETRLGGTADKVGRSLYVPIYLYMPLPAELDESIVARLSESKRDRFLEFYRAVDSGYRLQKQAPLAERDELWIALEEIDKRLSMADYKAGGKLRPVELEFVVTPAASGSSPRLEALRIIASSGEKTIDEAVQYGFRRATFFNATDSVVSGSFSYRFE